MKKEKIIIYILFIIVLSFFIWKIYPILINKTPTINIKYQNKEIKIGEQETIDYEVNDNFLVNWKSLNEDIVKVSGDTIIGINLGTTTIEGTITTNDNKTITNSFNISTYIGNKENKLKSIIIPEGELFITKGYTYELPLNFNPNDAYITSIEYDVNNSNIIKCDGKIYALNIGEANLKITVNKNITKNFIVNVIDKEIEPIFAKNVEKIDISQNEIVLNINETKELEYNIEPNNAYVGNTKIESSNPNIVDIINNNNIIAKSEGTANIKIIINNKIIKEIKVTVNIPVTEIKANQEKIIIKAGKTTSITTEITPENATNKKLIYTSSNPNLLTVDQNGKVTAISQGTGTINIKTEDGNQQVEVPFVVNPFVGLVDGDGGIWGYSSINDVAPLRADLNFFLKLTASGKGTLNNNTYTYTDEKNVTYNYLIDKSILKVENRNILMRFYYPPNVDLSTVNTFTLFGGAGERDFKGFFSAINKDSSLLKSNGIIILLSTSNDHNAKDGMYATDFVRSIVNQKKGIINTVAGYSMGGRAAGQAANDGIYDRLIIFNSYFFNVNNYNNLKNKEITFYSPSGDSLADKTKTCLDQIIKANYSDVTIVTNNKELISKYKSDILVVNPGEPMGYGHKYFNISPAKIFSYGLR